jgi:hypothetical protein
LGLASTTSVEQFQWNAIAKSGSVLLIVATICTAALAFLVQFDFLLPFWALATLMALNAFFAFASASLWTTMVVYQAHSYSALIAPTATDAGHAAAFGPGFYVLWVYFLCTLVLTPLMLQFTGLMMAQALVLLALFVGFAITMLLFMLMAMGATTQEDREQYTTSTVPAFGGHGMGEI